RCWGPACSSRRSPSPCSSPRPACSRRATSHERGAGIWCFEAPASGEEATGEGSMEERRLTLRGEIDLNNAPQLRANLRREVAEHDADLLVDCGQLTFIDSHG